MNRTKIVGLAIAGAAAVFLGAGSLSAQQPSGQEPKRPAMKSKDDTSMDGMMKQCHEHHQAMAKNIDEASKALEGAKQSNDPANMRAAIDQAQKQLADMREHMTMCGDMMNMMQNMPGGMMKGGN
ncbi:MAG TPA: hypothetical protein VGA73_06215 [Candidatus Binatia bacterium]